MLNVDLATAWTPAWQRFQQRAVRAWRDRIAAAPEAFRPQAQAFVEALLAARGSLDRVREGLARAPDPTLAARAGELETRYALLAAGLYVDARPADPALRGVPVGLAVAGLVLGIAGIAWSIAALQYATNLRDQTALLARELDARIDASRDGRSLPPSEFARPAPQRTAWLLVGLLAAVTAAVAAPVLFDRRAS